MNINVLFRFCWVLFDIQNKHDDLITCQTMSNKRVTMIKPVVGKVKSPSYPLPDNDFVYGIESNLDKENAGEGEWTGYH